MSHPYNQTQGTKWAVTSWYPWTDKEIEALRETLPFKTLSWARGKSEAEENEAKDGIHVHFLLEFKSNQRKQKLQHFFKILTHGGLIKPMFDRENWYRYLQKNALETNTDVLGDTLQPTKQGQRTDIKQILEACKTAEGDPWKVIEAYPNALYHLGMIEKACSHYDKHVPIETKCQVLYGPPGKGKSHYPDCKHGEDKVYTLTPSVYKTNFWNGYTGQPILFIDEFTDWIDPPTLNTILNGKLPINIKGSDRKSKFTQVYIGTNYHPSTWFNNWSRGNKDAFMRRADIIEFTAFKPCTCGKFS
nr:MAG: replication associated protein [Arizlama virus]